MAALAYGLARLGHHWLAEYDGRGLIFPPFFLLSSFDLPPALTRHNLLAIIHAAGILIPIILVVSYLTSSTPPVSSSTSYSLCRIVQLPAVSVPLRAVLTISGSSLTFSPGFIRNRPCRKHPDRHPHRHRTRRFLLDNHVAGILIDIVLVASYLTTSAAGILIDIVLVASYLTSSTPPVSSSTSYSQGRIVQLPAVSVPLRAVLTISGGSLTFSPGFSRNRPCRKHPHRHPHRHRTRHVVLYNFPLRLSL